MKLNFGPFVLDSDTRQLTRDGAPLHLTPKAFDLLAALAADRPSVLSKDVLLRRLWPDTFVAEANLSNLVAEVRQVLDDSPRDPRYIRTVHRFGYAFSGEAVTESDTGHAASQAAFWVEAGGRQFPLTPGEHVIGRDADAEIRLDSSTVSRRHARIVVSADSAILEDFGSKNGTFHGDARVTAPTPLANGDAIRIGSHLLTFRQRGDDTTETHVGLPG